MRKQIAVFASALLLGGGVYAQNALQTQKPKAYMVSDAHLDTQWNWYIQTTCLLYTSISLFPKIGRRMDGAMCMPTPPETGGLSQHGTPIIG